jgi:hypothetical protein
VGIEVFLQSVEIGRLLFSNSLKAFHFYADASPASMVADFEIRKPVRNNIGPKQVVNVVGFKDVIANPRELVFNEKAHSISHVCKVAFVLGNSISAIQGHATARSRLVQRGDDGGNELVG